MDADRKRIEWIDILKFFCIFFVMVSHLGGGGIALELHAFYEPFYLSGFLFASGYTYRHKAGFDTFIKKKIKQLLIPWALFSLINISLSQILSFHPEWHPGFFEELKNNLLQIRELGDGSMWFINALFVSYIPFYFLIDLYEKKDENNKDTIFTFLAFILIIIYELYIVFIPKSLFPWESNCLPWHIEYIPFANAFLLLGYLTRTKYEKVLKNISFFPLTAFYLMIVYLPFVFGWNINEFVKAMYETVIQVFGVLFIAIASRNIKPNKLILFIGMNTLLYYGMHGKVLALCEALIRKFLPDFYMLVLTNNIVANMYSLVMGVVLSILLIIPTKIVNRYFPVLAGNKYWGSPV